MKEEAFLEYINQLVMTGEVAGLLPKDEMDALLNDLRPILKRECPGKSPSVYDWHGVLEICTYIWLIKIGPD